MRYSERRIQQMKPSNTEDAMEQDLMNRPLIQLEKISRIFECGLVVALREIDLTLCAGELVAVVGPSGSGKSCLVNVLGGCDMPTSGHIKWHGLELGPPDWDDLRGSQIGIVFQDFLLLPTLTAIENVEMALLGRGIPARDRSKRAAELLHEVGLDARLHHLPNALSGGERQRVAIARSMANRPSLLLADEPTGNLDSANAATVFDLLLQIHRTRGASLLLVTHDEALAARCHRRIRMKDGRIVEDVATTGVRNFGSRP